jgi:hypothetical protein
MKCNNQPAVILDATIKKWHGIAILDHKQIESSHPTLLGVPLQPIWMDYDEDQY